MKVSLKIKIFMCFLHREVILTKNNLAKINWNGNQKYCCCDQDESIKDLFFDCQFAKTIWRIIHMPYCLSPPKNVTNIFGNWLKYISKMVLKIIRVRVCCAVLWAIWNIRNGLVFNQQKSTYFFAGYPFSYLLDPYVVLSPSNGSAQGRGFWVQYLGDGSQGFIQPMHLATT